MQVQVCSGSRPSSVEPHAPAVWLASSRTEQGSLQPNPSFERTHTGMPLQALISFWALRVLPARAAQLKR
jgi:hypothetical protein